MNIKKFTILLIALTVASLSLIYFTREKSIVYNYVSGDGHIYRGQLLHPHWHYQLITLSKRVCWLHSTLYGNIKMEKDLEQMINDAEQDGKCIVVMSAFRNKEAQQLLYNSIEDKEFVALPMESEHQTGFAIDITACPMNKDGVRDDSVQRLELRQPFDELEEYTWMQKNAYKYNFEESFTEYNQSITGFSAEPWHWKYTIN